MKEYRREGYLNLGSTSVEPIKLVDCFVFIDLLGCTSGDRVTDDKAWRNSSSTCAKGKKTVSRVEEQRALGTEPSAASVWVGNL